MKAQQIRVGPSLSGQDPAADGRQEHLAPLQETYGRLIGYPMLKPHDLRHGVVMEILEAQHDLQAVRAILGHVRLETTQIYAQIRPAQLKRAVEFYEAKTLDALGS